MCTHLLEVEAQSKADFQFLNNLGASFLATIQRNFLCNSPYNFGRTQVAGKIALFPSFFCWQQVLALILIGYFALFPWVFPRFLQAKNYLPRVLIGLFYLVPMSVPAFLLAKVLASSFDWFILPCSHELSREFWLGYFIFYDARDWPGCKTLARVWKVA